MGPLTRKEFFLNAIAEGTPTPPPLTREERYLAKIAENTGGDSLPPIEEGDDGKVLTASDGEAVWASGGGGSSDPYAGYDLVIKHDSFDYTISSDEYHVVKGDYNTLCDIGNQRLPIKALFYSASNGELWNTTETYLASVVRYTDYVEPGEDPFIQARFFIGDYVIIINYTSSGLDIVFD